MASRHKCSTAIPLFIVLQTKMRTACCRYCSHGERSTHKSILKSEYETRKSHLSRTYVQRMCVCVCARVCTCTHVAGLLGEEENDAKARQLRAQDVMAD